MIEKMYIFSKKITNFVTVEEIHSNIRKSE